MTEFQVGDLVKIADDYATGMWLRSKNPVEYGPTPHMHRGKTGHVIERSSDGERYGLEIEGKKNWWYDGDALSLVKPRPSA